jgi:hypothetical protein
MSLDDLASIILQTLVESSDQRRELLDELFLEGRHFGGDLLYLIHTIALKVVHGRLSIVNIDQMLLRGRSISAALFLVESRMQLKPFERCYAVFIECQDVILAPIHEV